MTNDYETVLRIDKSKGRMQITRLPFFDIFGQPVLGLNELPISNYQPGGMRNAAFSFQLHPKHIELINGGGYQFQLRMFQLLSDKKQFDDFPQKCTIKINEKIVKIPEIISTRTVNAEEKSHPINITQYIPVANIHQKHTLKIQWFMDTRKWAIGIWLVHPVNAATITNRFSRTGSRQSSEETKKKIIQIFKRGNDIIQMNQMKISLKCPIMKTRMKIPARSKICSHLQCFDLQNFLQLNEQTATWKCPICNGNASYDNLVIDQYFVDVIEIVEFIIVEEIQLSEDGKWKALDTSRSMRTEKKNNVEVITIDDSNDNVYVCPFKPADVALALARSNKPSSLGLFLSVKQMFDRLGKHLFPRK